MLAGSERLARITARIGEQQAFDLVTLGLRQKTYELLSLVRKPTLKEKKALEEIGSTFFNIEAKSLKQLERENPNHFNSIDIPNRLRVHIPSPMIVAINVNHPYVDDCFSKSQADQLLMIEESSSFHENFYPGAREVMLPASILAQLDIIYFKNTDGKEKLFKNFFARSLDQGVSVGRYRPEDKLRVGNCSNAGYDDVGVLSAVVFVNQK